MHGNWNHFAGLDVDESDADLVVVTMRLALNEPPRGGHMMRTAEGYAFRARVRLERPLGDRRVVDGARPTLEQARADEIRSAVLGRRRHGLDAREEHATHLVDALAAGEPGIVRHWTGFPLTVTENEQVLQVQREMDELRDAGYAWVRDGHEHLHAGSIHGWQPETMIFQVTDDTAAEELRSALAATGWTRFEVRTVRYSEEQLQPLIRRAMDLLREAGFDVRGGGLDTTGNRVQVRIWDDDDLAGAIGRAEELLAADLPEDSFVVGR
jgi:hypothetical protein